MTGAFYGLIAPGVIISGIGQGIVWSAMWIAAASGVAHHEQGIASGMASTTLNIGNAIGLAVLVALTHSGLSEPAGESLRNALAQGARQAFLPAAAASGVQKRTRFCRGTRGRLPLTTPPPGDRPAYLEPIDGFVSNLIFAVFFSIMGY
ncbi:hypothetical protein ABRZ24_12885 [Brenneria populi]|uniref:MFS transporter n=1 Tax=Brenneria populi TaxID=1505588 RepID=A0ABU6JT71_9GAMM|nr:hypothetical protein [Brenneria populi Li et al. 2015]